MAMKSLGQTESMQVPGKKFLEKKPGNKNFGKKVRIFSNPGKHSQSCALNSCDFFPKTFFPNIFFLVSGQTKRKGLLMISPVSMVDADFISSH